ncbi:MAG: hypothetical protein IPL52_06830 [Flavobacteriales bacterium]|nr:hypothetical protein [Flavobacteriales bacterium]
MTASTEDAHPAVGGLTFRKLGTRVQDFAANGGYDVIYYDAFGPSSQPEMWTTEVFQRMHDALRHGGVLVTYCAKGDVRRAMESVGLRVERLQGPPGKREMLRATKP